MARVTGRAENRGDLAVGAGQGALRATISLHVLGVFTQAVLAGRFLAGDYPMLAVHGDNGRATTIVGFAQLLCSVVYWRRGGGPGWPALASLAVSLAESVQIYLGANRIIGLHIPLGIMIVAGMSLFTWWAWGAGFRRRRATVTESVA
jgi:hypothetical protein